MNKNEYNKVLTNNNVLIGIAIIIFNLVVYRIVKEIKKRPTTSCIKQKGAGDYLIACYGFHSPPKLSIDFKKEKL